MEKTFNLRVKDMRNELSKVINSSGLPISMTTSVVRDLYNELITIEAGVIKNEEEQYNKSLSENNKGDKNNE